MRNNSYSILGIASYDKGEYGSISVSGIADIKEEITAQEIKVQGILKCKDNVFVSKIIEVKGCIGSKNLKSDVFYLEASGQSKIDKITANKLIIENRDKCKTLIKEIECDDINAECIKTQKIIANTLELKKDCIIEEIYYKSEYKIDSSCKVNKIIKL